MDTDPLDAPEARPETHSYLGGKITLTPWLNEDSSWGCSYQIVELNPSDLKVKKAKFIADKFDTPNLAKATALKAAQMEIEASDR